MNIPNRTTLAGLRPVIFALAIGWSHPAWSSTLTLEDDPLSSPAPNPVALVFPALADFFEDYRDFLALQDEFAVRVTSCQRDRGFSEQDCLLEQFQRFRVAAADLVGRSIPSVEKTLAAAEIERAEQTQLMERSERRFAERRSDAENAVKSVERRIAKLAMEAGNGQGQLTAEARFEITALKREWGHSQNSLQHWEMHAERLPAMRKSLQALEQIMNAIEDEVALVEHAIGLRLDLLNDFELFVEIDSDVRRTVAEFNRLSSIFPRLHDVSRSMFDGIDLAALIGDGAQVPSFEVNFNTNDEALIAWLRGFARGG